MAVASTPAPAPLCATIMTQPIRFYFYLNDETAGFNLYDEITSTIELTTQYNCSFGSFRSTDTKQRSSMKKIYSNLREIFQQIPALQKILPLICDITYHWNIVVIFFGRKTYRNNLLIQIYINNASCCNQFLPRKDLNFFIPMFFNF